MLTNGFKEKYIEKKISDKESVMDWIATKNPHLLWDFLAAYPQIEWKLYLYVINNKKIRDKFEEHLHDELQEMGE